MVVAMRHRAVALALMLLGGGVHGRRCRTSL